MMGLFQLSIFYNYENEKFLLQDQNILHWKHRKLIIDKIFFQGATQLFIKHNLFNSVQPFSL